MSETRDRLVKAALFLRAAEADIVRGGWDASVGRSYYCGFNAAVAYLIQCGVTPDDRGRWGHGWVQRRFREESRKADRQSAVGWKLRRLYEWRIVADYSPRPMPEMDARNAVNYAKEIHDFCDTRVKAEP